MVQVNVSDVGLGAVLSVHAATDQKANPRAFFTQCLSPAERKYNIGNQELLAVKMALKEWRNWLEGTTLPFLVWTVHNNLEYI